MNKEKVWLVHKIKNNKGNTKSVIAFRNKDKALKYISMMNKKLLEYHIINNGYRKEYWSIATKQIEIQ